MSKLPRAPALMLPPVLLVIMMMFMPIIANAGDGRDESLADSLVAQADRLELAKDTFWLRLLHVPSDRFTNPRSDIRSAKFFLATSGRTDPAAELRATLQAFFSAPVGKHDDHALCRFPARLTWLKQRLDWSGDGLPTVHCEKYLEWSLYGRVRSVSIVFASGFLSNPASLYGHPLLKFNSESRDKLVGLLDPSLSYGALVPEGQDGLSYIVKGLMGGYDGGYSHDQFFRHNHNYSETELRDLWEYELSLSGDEVVLLVEHGWELFRARFPYLFFSDNCATRLAELLGFVVDEPLLPPVPWQIPSTLFDRLAVAKHKGAPLVVAVRRIPSRESRFREKFAALDAPSQRWVRSIASDQSLLDSGSFAALPISERSRIVDVLIDYTEFRLVLEKNDPYLKEARRAYLMQRFRLPPGDNVWPVVEKQSPDRAQPPMMARVSGLHNDTLGNGLEFRLRPAYYDMLAPASSRVPDSTLSMFDLRLLAVEDGLRFRSLEIATVESLNISATGMEGDGGFAWRLHGGIEQHALDCMPCNVFVVEGGLGQAMSLTPDLAAYAMMEARLQTRHETSGVMATTPRAGLVWALSPYWKMGVSGGSRLYHGGEREHRDVFRWENRFLERRDADIRLLVERDRSLEVSAGASFYW